MPLISWIQATAERFAHAERAGGLLLLAGVLIAALLCGTWLRRQARKSWLGSPAQLATTGGSTALGMVLRFAALLLVGIAVIDPRLGHGSGEVGRSSEQIVLLLDRSRSMLAADAEPSRFGLATRIAEETIERAQGAAIALVSFAADARLESPLSRDDRQLRERLHTMRPEQDSAGGTQLARALRVAADCFARRFAGHKLLIVLTDGETHGPAELAEVRIPPDARVLLLGLGDAVQGARIPIAPADGNAPPTPPRYFEYEGRTVWTKSQPENLRDLARHFHGQQAMVSSAGEARRLVAEARGAVETSLRWERLATATPIYAPLLIAALALFAAEALLPSIAGSSSRGWPRRDRRHAAAAGTCLALVALCCACGAGPSEDGTADAALRRRETAQLYNSGVEAYRYHLWPEAELQFRRCMAAGEEKIAAQSRFNLANTQYQQARQGGMSKQQAIARLDEAIALYRQCIQQEQRIADARANLQIAYALRKRIETAESKDGQSGGDSPPQGSSSPPPPGEQRPPRGQRPAGDSPPGAAPNAAEHDQQAAAPPPGSTAPPSNNTAPEKWSDAEAEQELRHIRDQARRRGHGQLGGQAGAVAPSGLPW